MKFKIKPMDKCSSANQRLLSENPFNAAFFALGIHDVLSAAVSKCNISDSVTKYELYICPPENMQKVNAQISLYNQCNPSVCIRWGIL